MYLLYFCLHVLFRMWAWLHSFESSLLFPCKDVSPHRDEMEMIGIYYSHDWCMFWSLMLFKVFLTSAFLLYIFSASMKLKTKPSSYFILYIFTLNSLKLFISFKSFDSSLSIQNKSPAFSYNCYCLSRLLCMRVHWWKYSNCFCSIYK